MKLGFVLGFFFLCSPCAQRFIRTSGCELKLFVLFQAFSCVPLLLFIELPQRRAVGRRRPIEDSARLCYSHKLSLWNGIFDVSSLRTALQFRCFSVPVGGLMAERPNIRTPDIRKTFFFCLAQILAFPTRCCTTV